MKWLITGGAGFIGRNLLEELTIRPGEKVYILDNLKVDTSIYGRLLNFFHCDVTDEKETMKVFEQVKPDIVVHLASQTDVRKSQLFPEETIKENTAGLQSCLKAAIQNNCKKFVFASTGGIAGEAGEAVDEETSPNPISAYAKSKWICEQICQENVDLIDIIILRFSNVFGSYCFHKPSAIPKFIKNILQDKPITIFGDGTQTRDFLYAPDLAIFLIKLVLEDEYGLFCVASGESFSIHILLEKLSVISGKEIDINYSAANDGEILMSEFKNKKAKFYGFSNRWNIEDRLAKTYEWIKHFEKGS